MAFFKLKSGSTYDCRSRRTGKLYVFSGLAPVSITEPIDIEKFRGMKDMFVETDSNGNEAPGEPSAIPMAFTAHGMVPPKSYVKLTRPAPAPASEPAPAAQAAPRKIVSTKAPTPPVKEPTPSPEDVAEVEPVPAAVHASVEAQTAPEAAKPAKLKVKRVRQQSTKKPGSDQPQ